MRLIDRLLIMQGVGDGGGCSVGPSAAMQLNFSLPQRCQAHHGANSSFILSGQEMNHRCNLIRLCHNPALCVTALSFLALLVDSDVLLVCTLFI